VRKAIFEEKLKQPMRELVVAINGAPESFAPEYVTDPDKAIYRIYRDTRSAGIRRVLDHVAASSIVAAEPVTAAWILSRGVVQRGRRRRRLPARPEMLAATRRHIADRREYSERFYGAKAVRSCSGITRRAAGRAPKGFAADHPAADRCSRVFPFCTRLCRRSWPPRPSSTARS
jgi:hypothetical protein